MVRDVPGGGYRFLPGIDPYSSGVVAMPGHQVVFATLRALVPWRDGFALIDRHLRAEGRPQAALCAIALRITKPLSFEGFAEFNAGYREQLIAWGLLVAGSGEVDRLNADTIVRRGETSPDAIRDKAAFVVSVMHTRLRVLGADWPDVTAIDVYTPHPIEPFVQGTILRAAGPAAIRGVCWYPSHPPIAGLEYEMDLRGVAREIVL